MDNLTKYVNEQNDPFYVKGRNLGYLLGAEQGIQKGIQEGETKAQFQLIKNLLAETDFSDEKIAHLTGTEATYVYQIRQQSAHE